MGQASKKWKSVVITKGNVQSVKVIQAALTEFTEVSGLAPSVPKSTVFFCNVVNLVKHNILQIMPFSEGKLPVRYLGVPLISTRLFPRDCKILVERVRNRIGNWKNKWLSIAGRLQLVTSVLASLNGFWASVFILPSETIKDIEILIRGFLWCQGDLKHGKAKVSWGTVCLPKSEGGLGIKSLRDWNVSLMTKHIWNLLIHKDSLWVNWIHLHKIRGRNFWDITAKGDMSWTWRKILQIRTALRRHFWFRMGNGSSISAWFDIWDAICPLSDFLSYRVINRDFHINNTVAEIVDGSSWKWPSDWLIRFPTLNHLHDPSLSNRPDKLFWRSLDGVLIEFRTWCVWDTIRSRSDLVDWYSVVWYPMCIPRHAVHLWLTLKEKLKTQDRLKQWDVGPSTDLNLLRCSLCNTQRDSHSHLFFECAFSSQVWQDVMRFSGFNLQSASLADCVTWIKPIAARKTIRSVIFKLILGSATYFIWNERNMRLFQHQRHTKDQVVSAILEVVRLKLYSFKFKSSAHVIQAMDIWKIPRALIITT